MAFAVIVGVVTSGDFANSIPWARPGIRLQWSRCFKKIGPHLMAGLRGLEIRTAKPGPWAIWTPGFCIFSNAKNISFNLVGYRTLSFILTLGTMIVGPDSAGEYCAVTARRKARRDGWAAAGLNCLDVGMAQAGLGVLAPFR